MADDIHDPAALRSADDTPSARADAALSPLAQALSGAAEGRCAGQGDAVFRTIFEHAGVGIYQTTPDGRFLRANPALARMLGYETPERLIREVRDIGAQVYADPSTRRLIVDALASRDAVRGMLCEARRRDGSRLWVSESASRVCDAAGRIVGYVGTVEDVSLLIRSQEALQAAERNWRGIFENAKDGLYRAAPDGTVLRANPAFVRMLGYAEEAELLAAVNDPGRDWYVEPGRRERFKALLIRDGRVGDFVSEVVRHAKGDRIWISESARASFDADGTLLYYEGDVQDITGRRRAEEDYRAIFENASEGIYRSTPDGKVIRANPALVRMNGFRTEAEWKAAIGDFGRDWYVDPQRRAQFAAQIAETGRVQDFVSQVYRVATGETMWVLENAREVRAPDGALLYYEGTARDITEQRAIEEAMRNAMSTAEASNRAKSDFLANMSHELRTPLNAIIGFSDIIRSEAFGPLQSESERYRAYVKDIHESGTHLLQLIEDILDVSKAEAGQLPIDDSPIGLPEVLQSAVQMMRERARKGQVDLDLVAPAGLPMLLADRRRILQIALNLVSNAVKFTPAKGSVRATAFESPAGSLVMRVTDTGVGIPAEEQVRVFEPFVQLNNSSGTASEGTGLGLPLTRKLVELHGGTLSLDSRSGRGTRIDVAFPKWRTLRRRESEGSACEGRDEKGPAQGPAPSAFEGAAIAAITTGLPRLR
jgi:PAS domain S-box-containing protein